MSLKVFLYKYLLFCDPFEIPKIRYNCWKDKGKKNMTTSIHQSSSLMMGLVFKTIKSLNYAQSYLFYIIKKWKKEKKEKKCFKLTVFDFSYYYFLITDNFFSVFFSSVSFINFLKGEATHTKLIWIICPSEGLSRDEI